MKYCQDGNIADISFIDVLRWGLYFTFVFTPPLPPSPRPCPPHPAPAPLTPPKKEFVRG